jgi:DNA-binding transcriptional LysR family regulator
MRSAAARLGLAAAGEANAPGGSVRLTASIFVSHYVLPQVLAQLRREAPEITVDLVASDASENLLFHEADIAIRMYRPTQLDMVTRHLCDAPLGIFAAKSYLQRRGVPAGPDELMRHDIIGYDSSDLIIKGMRDHGLEAAREDFAIRCDNQAAYWALVRAGCGLGFGQLATGRADPLVDEIPLSLHIPPLPVWLTTHEKLRHNPPVARVWAHLVQHVPPLLDPR